MTGIDIVLDAHATIGEQPTWSPDEAVLYWIDIKAPALYRFDPATGAQRTWPVSADIGGFALMPDLAGALVALRTGLYDLDFATGALSLIAAPPYDPAMHRFNEGACDPSGKFWIGVMFDPIDPASTAFPAALHSFTREAGLERQPDEAELHNGMAWSADGRHMFVAHSRQQEVLRYDLQSDGRIGQPVRFAIIPPELGLPDGAAVDTDGGYWCALHGGGGLRRFHDDGSLDRDIPLPISQPTMCAFGGADLDTLFITSATDGLDAAQLCQQPHAGALLALKPGGRGIPRRSTLA